MIFSQNIRNQKNKLYYIHICYLGIQTVKNTYLITRNSDNSQYHTKQATITLKINTILESGI